MNTIALQATNIRATLQKVPVLKGIDVQFKAGHWTSIVGPNGAGKSTLLHVLAGLMVHEGQVDLLGKPLQNYPARARAQALAWLGQNESGGDDLQVWDVVMLGRLPHQAWLAAPSAQDNATVEQALRSTQAWDWRHKTMARLSGGERQRVRLARALAVQAQVLLMDEPLANLDPPHQADWLVLMRILTAQGKTVLSVLHETNMALQADDMIIMNHGAVVYAGATQDQATHHALEAVFQHRIRIISVDNQWVALPRVDIPSVEFPPAD